MPTPRELIFSDKHRFKITTEIGRYLSLKCLFFKMNSPCILYHRKKSNDFYLSGSSDDLLCERKHLFLSVLNGVIFAFWGVLLHLSAANLHWFQFAHFSFWFLSIDSKFANRRKIQSTDPGIGPGFIHFQNWYS